MNDADQLLRERIRPLGVGPALQDWPDVRRRARAHGHRRIQRRWVVVAVAAAIAALVVGPALGLGGSVLDLFRDPGKPALSRTALHPVMRLSLDKRYGDWSLHKVASDGKTAFYALRDGKGNVVCIGSGREGTKMPFGLQRCGEESALGADRPIYYDLTVEASVENSTPHPWRVTGVAVEEVETIAILAGDERLETPVEDNAFTITKFPPIEFGRVEIVALDGDDNIVFREPLRGFGAAAPPPPPPARPLPPPPPRPRLTPLPGEEPIQRGRSGASSAEVYRSGAVVFRMAPRSRAARLAGPSFGCVKFTPIDGREYPVWAGGTGNLAPTGVELGGTTRGWGEPLVEAPFDGCEVHGSFGRHWNDPRGIRAPVEVPLTPKGRRYFDRRAAARDLALFVRSPRIVELRRLLKRDAAAQLPTAAAIARKVPSRVVAGRNAGEGVIALWTRGRRLVAATTVDGQRLFVETSDGRIARHNLDRLAKVF
jgi:hypothetical protein